MDILKVKGIDRLRRKEKERYIRADDRDAGKKMKEHDGELQWEDFFVDQIESVENEDFFESS